MYAQLLGTLPSDQVQAAEGTLCLAGESYATAYEDYTEDDIRFHLPRGALRHLDARRVNSGSVLGPARRIHLVYDLTDAAPERTLVSPIAGAGDPCLVERPSVPADLAGYPKIAPYFRAAPWGELVSILARVHLTYHLDAAFYDWLGAIAGRCGVDSELLDQDVDWMKRYHILDGPDAAETFAQMRSARSKAR
jgi:hypothetical protein